MKKNTFFRLLALTLCLVLLAGCSKPIFDFDLLGGGDDVSGTGGNTGEARQRRTIPYSEMAYTRPDTAAIKAEMADLTEKLENAGSFDELMELDNRVGEISEAFNTMHTLASLKKYHDSTDEYFEEEYRYLEDEGVELTTLINDFNRVIADGPYAGDYEAEVGAYVYQSMLDSLMLDSAEVQVYKKERASLNADYNKKLSTLTVEYNGTEYTADDLYGVADYDTLIALYDLFFAGNADEFAEMYARMVELDKQTAATLGFDSAIDMYYLGYSRDYTKEDALRLCQNVKEYLVPLVPLLYSGYSDAGAMAQSHALELMPETLAAVDPELVDAWKFMEQYGLYDIESLPNKQSGIAFTTSISVYDAPFLFMSWDEGYSSLTTLTHEFGHFYDFWLHYDEDVVFNLDIAEVYSQGLELLMHGEYERFGGDAEAARLANLYSIAVGALINQSAYEDFQMQAYELDSLDANTLGKLYYEVMSDYGLGAFTLPDENGAEHSWFQITHFFDAPFYTISYVTSAAAAMQIWADSQEDWRAAADTYLKLIHEDQNQSFTKLLEGAGLRAPHDLAVISDIADALVDEFYYSDAAA